MVFFKVFGFMPEGFEKRYEQEKDISKKPELVVKKKKLK